MSAEPTDTPFFIGWATPDRRLWPFLLAVAVLAFVASFSIAYMVAATQDDPGAGGRMGRVEALGVLQVQPYPILHVLESEQFEAGTTVLLMGQGKNGAQGRADPLDGQIVRVSGTRLNRGDLDGIILRGGQNGVMFAEDAMVAAGQGTLPETEDLGRWRLTGEICDGNCLAGAMRPGTGLAHRACANLCILGGLPPVFVATDTVAGREFFLVANADGTPMPDSMLDYTALLIEAEGRVERHGGMNVFLIDESTVDLAQ
ncbi:hypothetical protein [Jannaschia sp. CCS1]|uniref:hypothetical protein n=1 Tax=Jannaschia sp. (strain CCS1) TaxID=290400 RepID=UPI00006C009D|nr:hypothetical protein [Jannaschia sp. CCS1]ABD56039.1 hypothetical protein Jann_3122 [Jannaschia sp. CCS1]